MKGLPLYWETPIIGTTQRKHIEFPAGRRGETVHWSEIRQRYAGREDRDRVDGLLAT